MSRKTFKIYLAGEYYDTFDYAGGYYQGKFGRIEIRELLGAINGLPELSHISLEILEEEKINGK
jgi:hypothetical protein